jgi:multiple sugar transport system substrate-binding protein
MTEVGTHNAENVRRGWLRIFRRLVTGRVAVFLGTILALLLLNSIRTLLFPPPPPEPGDIVILSGKDDSVNRQREQLVEQWNSQHPENRAVLKTVPGDADAQHSAMVSQAQTADSAVDIYNLDVTWVTEFAQAHYIRPLDGADTGGFLAKPLSTCQVDGTLYALPFNTDAGLLFYRTDLVPDAPQKKLPPSAETMHEITRSHPEVTGGYAMQLGHYEGLTVNALESIWAAGGDVVNGSGQVTIDSAEVAAGLRRLAQASATPAGQSGVKPGVWPESYGRPDGQGGRERDSTDAFAAGDVVLMRNWPVAYGQLTHQPDGAPSAGASGHFAVAQLPGPSVLGGQDLAIASDSRRPRAAQALIEFLTNDTSEKQLFREGALPATRADAYSDALVRTAQPYATTLLTALNNARLRPVTPNYPLFSSVFQRIVLKALDADGKVPSSAVRELTNALNGRLE